MLHLASRLLKVAWAVLQAAAFDTVGTGFMQFDRWHGQYRQQCIYSEAVQRGVLWASVFSMPQRGWGQ